MTRQQVVVENRTGGARNIGAGSVAKSEPDGYTLMVTESGVFVINPNLYAKGSLTYDAEKDFEPISGLARFYLAIVAHPSLPVSSIHDLIALAKSKPGEISYATTGIGGGSHMSIVAFEDLAGVHFLPVHYRGGAPAFTDLVGGHVSLMSVSLSLSLKPSQAGLVKILGLGAPKRAAAAPNIPTVAESGLPGYQAHTSIGLFAPAGIPRDVAARLNAEVQKIVADPAFQQRFLSPHMLEPITGTVDEFEQSIRTERANWAKIIQRQKLKVE